MIRDYFGEVEKKSIEFSLVSEEMGIIKGIQASEKLSV